MARLGLGAAGALPLAVDGLAPEVEAAAIPRDAGCRWLLTSHAHTDALRARGLAEGLCLTLLEDTAGAGEENWRTLSTETAGPLPLHHVYPLLVGLMTPLAAGSAIVFPEAVTAPQILQALRGARVTAMTGVSRRSRAGRSALRSCCAVAFAGTAGRTASDQGGAARGP